MSRTPLIKPPIRGRLKRREDEGADDTGSRRGQRASVMTGAQKVRITGGSMRSRRIHFPAAPGLRPTPDRVRETIFNWLGQDLSGQYVLDLFAGSGILGIESLSRGAAWVGMVEQSPRVVDDLRKNMHILDVPPERIQIWRSEALAWFKHPPAALMQPINLVFLDPPFAHPTLLQAVLERLNEVDWLLPSARLYVEQSANQPVVVLPGWSVVRQGRAGESLFMLWARTEQMAPA